MAVQHKMVMNLGVVNTTHQTLVRVMTAVHVQMNRFAILKVYAKMNLQLLARQQVFNNYHLGFAQHLFLRLKLTSK